MAVTPTSLRTTLVDGSIGQIADVNAVHSAVNELTASASGVVVKGELVTNVANAPYSVSSGGTAAANTAGILAAFAASTGKVLFPPGMGTVLINAELAVPFNVYEIEVGAGTRILQTTDTCIFTRFGTWGTTENLGTSITQGNRSATVADATIYPVGSWVLCHGTNVITNSTDKFGYLRCVTANTGTTLTFDATIPRTISTTPRVTPVTLAPSLAITGRGSVGYQTPSANVSAEAIHFCLVDRPIFTSTVSGGGDDGVRFSHCVGGLFDGHCEDLLDNGTNFGYGVDVSGATRGLVVRGSATRVRHAVTTLSGPALSGSVAFIGEPENCDLGIHAYNCTNKGIDTHRPGWGNIIRPNVHGCPSGGVQIRADATVVLPGIISGCSSSGLNVDSTVVVAPRINGLTVLWQRTAGPALLVGADAIVSNLTVRGFFGIAVQTTAGAALYLTGADIDGLSASSTTALSLAGDNSRIDGVRTTGCTTDITNTGTGNQILGINGGRYLYASNGNRYLLTVGTTGTLSTTLS